MPPPPADRDDFATTEWGVVLQARGTGTDTRAALAELCRQYWFPVYAYLRRKTGSAADAEDLTQGFFAHLLDGDALARVDPARGRFRAFLLAACNHFVSNERAKATALKRGGGRPIASLDAADAEARYRSEPADHLTPDRVFDRQWGLALLDGTLRDLAAEYATQPELFVRLRSSLTGGADAARYADVAVELGMTEAAVKKAAKRLRERYGVALRRRIAATVGAAADIDDEIRGLFAALSGA